ncbi:MAG: hypothetical protein HPY53_01340 [Brevinematales bacterium]|nr:hypothetical protein [Brevinematales bacterium]
MKKVLGVLLGLLSTGMVYAQEDIVGTGLGEIKAKGSEVISTGLTLLIGGLYLVGVGIIVGAGINIARIAGGANSRINIPMSIVIIIIGLAFISIASYITAVVPK